MTKVKKIVADYKAGLCLNQLANKYKMDRQHIITKYLGDLYYTTLIDEDTLNKIKEDLKSGLSCDCVATKYNVKPYLVGLISCGIKRKIKGTIFGGRAKTAPSKDKIIKSLKSAHELGIRTYKDYGVFVKSLAYSKRRKYVNEQDIIRVYRTWNNAKKAAGLEIFIGRPERKLSLAEIKEIKSNFLKYFKDKPESCQSVFSSWVRDNCDFGYNLFLNTIRTYYGPNMGLCEFLLLSE